MSLASCILLLPLIAFLCIWGAPVTTREPEKEVKELKAEELIELIESPSHKLISELRTDPQMRQEYHKVMSILTDLSMPADERKRTLLVMYPNDAYEIGLAVPLYETIGTELVKDYFPKRPELGAEFFRRSMVLLGEEQYLRGTKDQRMSLLRDIIAKQQISSSK